MGSIELLVLGHIYMLFIRVNSPFQPKPNQTLNEIFEQKYLHSMTPLHGIMQKDQKSKQKPGKQYFGAPSGGENQFF